MKQTTRREADRPFQMQFDFGWAPRASDRSRPTKFSNDRLVLDRARASKPVLVASLSLADLDKRCGYDGAENQNDRG